MCSCLFYGGVLFSLTPVFLCCLTSPVALQVGCSLPLGWKTVPSSHIFVVFTIAYLVACLVCIAHIFVFVRLGGVLLGPAGMPCVVLKTCRDHLLVQDLSRLSIDISRILHWPRKGEPQKGIQTMQVLLWCFQWKKHAKFGLLCNPCGGKGEV